MAPGYGATTQPPPPSVERFIPPAEENAWIAKVFGIYGLETLCVSCMCLYCMVDEATREKIQTENTSSVWWPMVIAMAITWLSLLFLSDRSPLNIFAQLVYLAVWGTALACVTASHYPGFGVLLTPGIVIVSVGIFILALFAKMTYSPFDFSKAFLLIVVLTSAAFQYVCWTHEDQFSGSSYPVCLPFIFCNLYMVLVEAYLLWKTGQQKDATKCGDVWAVTAVLLQESFGMPLLMPLPALAQISKICWNCWGKRAANKALGREEPKAPDVEAYIAPYAASYTWNQLANPGVEGQSWADWLMGKEPEKTPGELRDERYVGYVMCMALVLRQYEGNDVSKEEALQRMDHYRNKIIQLDEVDSERARVMLDKEGLTDNARRNMLLEYHKLRRLGGYEVAPNDLGGMSSKSSPSGFVGGLEAIFRAT